MIKFFTKQKLKSLISEHYTRGFMSGMSAQVQASRTRKIQDLEIESENLINKTIIGVSNEYQNPVIGKVTGFEPSKTHLIPIVEDMISGEKVWVNGVFKIYTSQLFHALMKLTPEERAALMFSNIYAGRTVVFNKEPPCAETILTPIEMVDRLVTKGFQP